MYEAEIKELIEAILEQAVDDYLYLKKRNKKIGYRDNSQISVKEIEVFFKSQYFNDLTGLDGKFIWKQLEEMEYEKNGLRRRYVRTYF